MKWEPYDPGWLAQLARAQHPDKPWLAESLSTCTKCQRKGEVYIRFVNARQPNRPGSPWQYKGHVFLKDPDAGNLVVDVLEGNRVGGVEFYDRLFKQS